MQAVNRLLEVKHFVVQKLDLLSVWLEEKRDLLPLVVVIQDAVLVVKCAIQHPDWCRDFAADFFGRHGKGSIAETNHNQNLWVMDSDVCGLVQVLDVVGRQLPDTLTDRLIEREQDVDSQHQKAEHDEQRENDGLRWHERVVRVVKDTDFELENGEGLQVVHNLLAPTFLRLLNLFDLHRQS